MSNTNHHAKRRTRRRIAGIAAICALGASAIGIPTLAAQAGDDTCSSGLLLNTLIQIGDCESGGGGDDRAAPVAPASQQQQQQSSGGGGGGGGASSSSSSSSSGSSGAGS